MCRFSRLPHVSKCCCYISLRISAYLIGFLQLIFGLGIIVSALAYSSTDKGSGGQDVHDTENNHDSDRTINMCVFGIAFTLLGVLLILGVKIKNLLLLRVYIAIEIIGLLVGFVIYLIILINMFLAFVIAADDDSSDNFVGLLIKIFAISTAHVLVVVIIIAFAIIALKAYFLLCVNSYLRELIKLESGTPLAVGYTAVTETDDNIKFG
ncbi:uncharacterized protein LOC119074942 [Bradysia coprophila]|uniref:uncharacterized protein LOC119074879 n=1 Tax=Bradysia coprophila TaxID=38358 RepID=UPI00187DCE5A|nr:uncharacterized protein LOC119074879 [Bradysia coprophila]XP_037037229.1 uncharacterized protein LOC119074942 [Bradysia coprophila]